MQCLCFAQLLMHENVMLTILPGTTLSVKGDVLNNTGTTIENNGSIDLTGDWINNSGNVVFGASAGAVILNGVNQSIAGTDPTRFYTLDLFNGIKTMQVDATMGGVGFPLAGNLNCNNAVLDLNSHTLTINNSGANAITKTTGYILSEDVDNSSRVYWANCGTIFHTIPFGNTAGEDASFSFSCYPSSGGIAGEILVSTYATAPNNTPFPVTPTPVTHVHNAAGIDNSANTVDRFWHIEKMGTFDFTFSYAPSENASNGNLNMRAQQWSTTNFGWNAPLPGQSNPTAQEVFVPGVLNINPVSSEGYTWTVSSQASPLPVELFNFFAVEKNNSEVYCSWQTASEINNDYFILMRSKDGLNFEEIAKVDGAGNSNIVLNYSFIDKHPFFGNSYYKLKQVDFNGDYNYSVTREVKLSKQGSSFSIYPNPVTNNLYLSISGSNNITKVYEIKDLMGKTIKRDSLSSDAFQYVVSLKGLANGFYLIEVFCGVEKWTEKFQVLQ